MILYGVEQINTSYLKLSLYGLYIRLLFVYMNYSIENKIFQIKFSKLILPDELVPVKQKTVYQYLQRATGSNPNDSSFGT